MNFIRLFFFVIISLKLYLVVGYTQDSLQIIDILTKISDMQMHDDAFYRDGLFVSERFFGQGTKISMDNNIFFSALIAYTLQSCYSYMSLQNRNKVDSITAKIIANYVYYRNRNGDLTYNFWQTTPVEQFFPNHKIWSKTERFRLADDFDDTAIIYLTQNNNDSLNKAVKQKMIQHTNMYHQTIRTTFKRYRHFRAYDNWFGTKMKPEFDICVLSNTLLFVFNKKLTLNQYDSASINLIIAMLQNNDHIKNSHIISPSYQNTAIILYHISRLLQTAASSMLDTIRGQVIQDIKHNIYKSQNRMEQIILKTSLYRLGETPDFEIDLTNIEQDFNSFIYFRAYLFSQNKMWLKKLVGKHGKLDYKYRSTPYYYTLILEYLLLKNR